MRLSICIPTYNFGAFIGATLDSIIPQLAPDVEIVVVDGASTDDTAAIVASRSSHAVRYRRLDRRGGIDADVALAVEEARGEYVWFFSADDIMRPGALARCLATSGAADVLVCKHTNATKTMELVNVHPVLVSDLPRTANFGIAAERQAWFADACTTEAFFSFLGGLVVQRRRFTSIAPVERFMGSCWGHVARLFALARAGLVVQFVPEVWLDKRSDNDSFMTHGVVQRMRLTIDGYRALADEYWGRGTPEHEAILRALRTEYAVWEFMRVKRLARAAPEREDMVALDEMMRALYGGAGWKNRARRIAYRAPVAAHGAIEEAARVYARVRRAR